LVGAGLGGFLIACGDDDNTVTPKDGGSTETSTGDSGGGGGDASTDAPPPPVDAGSPARLQLVNAATDFGPNNASGGLRVCFAAGTTAANVTLTGLPALPDESSVPGVPPAVYIGLGGNVTGTGLPLSALFIQPYLMNAQSLAAKGIVKPGPGQPGKGCSEILASTFDAGTGPLVENVDYWKLPVINSGTFLNEKSYLLVLTGCTGDTAIENKQKCGDDGFNPDGGPGPGNLAVRIYDLDRATAIPADKVGTQFVHASASAAFYLGTQFVQVNPAYQTTKGDPSTAKSVSTPPDSGVTLYDKTDLVQVSGVNFASDYFTANPAVAPLAIELPLIQAISYPTGVPEGGAYANGASWTFIAVGDADPTVSADAGGRFNTKKFHYLAFPNNPPVSVYKP
jgi:hypothetical protein